MTTTLAQAETAALDLLKTLPGINPYPTVPNNPDFPAVFFNPIPAIDYRDSMETDALYLVDLVVLGSAALDERLSQLVPYLERSGDHSIFALFETNRNLGFTDVDAHVRDARPLDMQEAAGYMAYGAVVSVVIAIGP